MSARGSHRCTADRRTGFLVAAVLLVLAVACGSAPAASTPSSSQTELRTFALGLGKHTLKDASTGDKVTCANGVGAGAYVPKPGEGVGGNADAVAPGQSTSITINTDNDGTVTVTCGG
jgi:hypothetical protein